MKNVAGETRETIGGLNSIMIATGEPNEQGEKLALEHSRGGDKRMFLS